VRNISVNFDTFNKEFFEDLSDIDIKNLLISSFKVVKTDFMKIPLDIRLTTFPNDLLIKIHRIYGSWELLVSLCLQIIKEYENHNIKNLKESLQARDPHVLARCLAQQS
jgi:hypothetical protein